MANIQFINQIEIPFTTVENTFIDKYMAKANGTYVKIYLYMLRNLYSVKKSSITTALIAKSLDILESDVVNGLKYWDNLNVINFTIDAENSNIDITINSLNGIENLKSNEALAHLDNSAQLNKTDKIKVPSMNLSAIPPKPTYIAEEISIYKNNSNEVKNIFEFAEKQFGRPLKYEDYNILLGIYDWLKLPEDVISILIQYCANSNYNLRYMEKVAINWSKKNIDTKEKALTAVTEFDTLYSPIMKYLGINSLNEVDKNFINTWSYDYGFDLKIILKAIEVSIQTAGNKTSMNYINKVLEDWKRKNLTTVSQIEKYREEWQKTNKKRTDTIKTSNSSQTMKKNKFLNFTQTRYDFDKIEQMDLEIAVQNMKKAGIINESSKNN